MNSRTPHRIKSLLAAAVAAAGLTAAVAHPATAAAKSAYGVHIGSEAELRYSSWTWINIFYGSEPGDYDYCATGGSFHGKRVSKKS